MLVRSFENHKRWIKSLVGYFLGRWRVFGLSFVGGFRLPSKTGMAGAASVHTFQGAELERIQQRSRRTNALRDFVELKLHVACPNPGRNHGASQH